MCVCVFLVGSIMFHVRRRPADSQPRRRKKKVGTGTNGRPGNEPLLLEVAPDATPLENGRRIRITDVVEVNVVHYAPSQYDYLSRFYSPDLTVYKVQTLKY